ncbi:MULTISPECIES: FadR/GntR family transcriptional regulator [Burkholderiaceae]|uniref:GntR family transcriptional regulator n=2 Tax=Burkholderiaceae TaxID=119060 RepID=A0A5E4VT79_9BURK|nr:MULTISPECIES: FCD domain-containing protein [Burkholderiaceae]CAG9187697.1 Glc operon transcriptional activator [Cupriavidus pinatubonensis]VVE15687.1 GntR family transcriptional regulator [Pandoraea cepalis]
MSEIEVSQVVRTNGAKELARYLVEEISNGTLAVGIKLPAERELSERFNASRGAVRRVLGELKSRGLITQVVGSGTFVAAAPETTPAAAAGKGIGAISPAELMQARLLIEPMLPSLIVQYGTPQDFARMDECIERSEEAKTVEEFEHWDGALHEALAVATHNNFIRQILELATQVREQGEWGRLKQRSLTPERRTTYEEQHRALVNALKDRDEVTARQVIEQHLLQIQRNLFGR